MIAPPDTVPRLETERLVLRRHRVDDFDDCVAMWTDPEVTRHIGGRLSTAEETWSRVLRYVGHWTLLGFGFWALEEKSSGRFAGEAGFADFKRDMTPRLPGVAEIGWALASWAHGRGLATEAVRAVIAWGDVHFGDRPTACMINPGNAASIRIADKCGYRQTGQTTYKGEPVLVFRRGRPGGACTVDLKTSAS